MADPPERTDIPLEDLMMRQLFGLGVSPAVSRQIHDNGRRRGRTPSGVEGGHLATGGRPRDPAKLWIVDRVLEPQTVAHFLEYLPTGMLPSGRQTQMPVLAFEELMLLNGPYADWALEPAAGDGGRVIDQLFTPIGSMEDSSRLQIISKELHAMKSRVWEGVMPVSERRWRDRKLDDPDPTHFTAACQLLSSVVNVFHYVNHPQVKAALRGTFNLIYDNLTVLDAAINLKRASEGKDPVSVAALWEEYIRDHYHVMVNRSHSWVIDKVNRLRIHVLDGLANHQTRPPWTFTGDYMHDLRNSLGEPDEETWALTNKVHDLVEIAAHADFAIFIPMDGYKGAAATAAAATAPDSDHTGGLYDAEPNGSTPIRYSPDMEKRRAEYHARLKLLSRVEDLTDSFRRNDATGEQSVSESDETARSARAQIRAQDRTREELRGPPVILEKESWIRYFRESTKWGFVCYRVTQESDAAWNEFRAKFEADISNWGEESAGLDEIKARPMIHWVNAGEHGLPGNIEGLKRHFATMKELQLLPEGLRDDLFLVADEQSVLSYTNPLPESKPAGDSGGSVLLVDADFDPAEGSSRPDESPDYDGTLRVLGSLLWDDVSAMAVMQSQWPEDLWGLAMHHPLGVYVGPVVKVQETAWRRQLQIRRSFFTAYRNFHQQGN